MDSPFQSYKTGNKCVSNFIQDFEKDTRGLKFYTNFDVIRQGQSDGREVITGSQDMLLASAFSWLISKFSDNVG